MTCFDFYLKSVICGKRLVAKFAFVRFARVDGADAHLTFAMRSNVLDQLPLGRILLAALRALLFLQFSSLLLLDILGCVSKGV